METEDFEQKQEIKLAKINTAGLQNLRRDEIWKDANKHSRNGEFEKWNEDLDAMWRELVGSVKKDSDDEKEFLEINNKYNVLKKPKREGGFSKPNEDYYKLRILQKAILIKKETFLRRLEDNQGKGTAYQDDAEDYMLG